MTTKIILLFWLLIIACCAPGPVNSVSPPSDTSKPTEVSKPVPIKKTPPKPIVKPATATIEWHELSDATAQLALDTNRMVMVYVFADWCPYCKMMSNQTLKNTDVIEILNKNFIAVKVDGEEDPSIVFLLLGEKAIYPSTVFFYPNKKEGKIEHVGHVEGFIDSENYILLLQMILVEQAKQNE